MYVTCVYTTAGSEGVHVGGFVHDSVSSYVYPRGSLMYLSRTCAPRQENTHTHIHRHSLWHISSQRVISLYTCTHGSKKERSITLLIERASFEWTRLLVRACVHACVHVRVCEYMWVKNVCMCNALT